MNIVEPKHPNKFRLVKLPMWDGCVNAWQLAWPPSAHNRRLTTFSTGQRALEYLNEQLAKENDMPTIEEILDAAEVLEELRDKDHVVMNELKDEYSVTFSGTARQLRKIAELRTPKPFMPKVYISYDPDDTVVSVEKSDGGYVRVYVGENYLGDGGSLVHEDSEPFYGSDLIFGEE